MWREVEYFREENQEVLREGCKACVTHLTCVTNVMWTRQGLTHKHRCVCYAHKVCSTDVTHTQCILTLLCDAIFEMHTTCRTSWAPADGKFWFWGKVLQVLDESTSRFAERTATLQWWANIKGRSVLRRLRYILVCWDYMSSSQTKKTIDTQRRWLVQDCNYN